MATQGKKPRARWDSDTERKLIDVWADILGEFSGIMMMRKKKETIATTRLNAYVSEELNSLKNTTRRKFAANWTPCSTKQRFECDQFTVFFAVAVNVTVTVVVVFGVVRPGPNSV